jgi:hypothetical protein
MMQSDYEHLILTRQRHEELVKEGLRRQRFGRPRSVGGEQPGPVYRRMTYALGTALIAMGRHLRSL